MSVASTAEVMERKISVPQCAQFLNVSTETVRRMIKRGELVGYRIGHNFRVPMSSLRQLLGDSLVEVDDDE